MNHSETARKLYEAAEKMLAHGDKQSHGDFCKLAHYHEQLGIIADADSRFERALAEQVRLQPLRRALGVQ